MKSRAQRPNRRQAFYIVIRVTGIGGKGRIPRDPLGDIELSFSKSRDFQGSDSAVQALCAERQKRTCLVEREGTCTVHEVEICAMEGVDK